MPEYSRHRKGGCVTLWTPTPGIMLEPTPTHIASDALRLWKRWALSAPLHRGFREGVKPYLPCVNKMTSSHTAQKRCKAGPCRTPLWSPHPSWEPPRDCSSSQKSTALGKACSVHKGQATTFVPCLSCSTFGKDLKGVSDSKSPVGHEGLDTMPLWSCILLPL